MTPGAGTAISTLVRQFSEQKNLTVREGQQLEHVPHTIKLCLGNNYLTHGEEGLKRSGRRYFNRPF